MEHLRFAPDILRRLGEELNPNPDQGILELVRNAYDADAGVCRVELVHTEKPGGTIRITDDGIGMNQAAIRDGWLVVGSSHKEENRLSGKSRRMVGNKGLGRLAALRMGKTAVVETRPIGGKTGFRVRIDWARFDNAKVVESVPIELTRLQRPAISQGTVISIEGLHNALDRGSVHHLARALVLLADPFGDPVGFRPILVTTAFKHLEKLVQNAYFDAAELHLRAVVDQDGLASATVLNRHGKTRFSADHSQIAGKKTSRYAAPPAQFDLWMFNLKKESFSPLDISLKDIQEWLSEVGGVHLYHRGLRVHPYGDAGHDWLEMNLSRARSPEMRPSTNTSIGRIVVTDPRELLKQKTDRSGFVENAAFVDLKRFAIDTLDWLSRERIAERDQLRTENAKKTGQSIRTARTNVATALKTLPIEERSGLETAIKDYEKAWGRVTHALRDDLQLYRTLSTIGTTSSVLAHEVRKPVEQIVSMAKTIDRRGKVALGIKYDTTLKEPVELIVRSAEGLKTFANVTLTLLDKKKRKLGKVPLNQAIQNMVTLFQPFLTDANVTCEPQLDARNPLVFGSVAALESIIANLITNSVNAFIYNDSTALLRRIELSTSVLGSAVQMHLADTGPGIRGLSMKQIWMPGETTTPGGAGLGLTIVRDTVIDLGGEIDAKAKGPLGGAEFEITLPLAEDE